ncbi:MAG: ATP-dependent Clp protease ATP-binding subunit [Lachnospiraceae bacterium]|nr:ATP-dependent Clp protease ATP-binding subunit [Lachnospiraceae bacterium]
MEKYTEKAKTVLRRAARYAAKMGQGYIGTEHLLLGIVADKNSLAGRALNEIDVTEAAVGHALVSLSETGNVAAMSKPKEYTPRLTEVLEDADDIAKASGETLTGTEHMLLAILRHPGCVAGRVIASLGVDARKLYSGIMEAAQNPALAQAMNRGLQPERQKKRMLEKYTRDLTALAAQGKLDAVIGRDEEIGRVVRILSRRTKNNPCLIGEPGVGKTAIVESIAQRIAAGSVPAALVDKRLLAADITAMVAGSKYRGEFEERIKGLISEASADENILLFIDEVHTLIGAGNSEGGMDAANILKPALARGELQIIGATTVNEYKKHIEKDAALERRFQPVMVEEPTTAECEEILKGLRPAYEEHHGVRITDGALSEAVRLSARYIADRFLPDKAIDVIDEACAGVKLASASSDVRARAAYIEREREEAILAGDFSAAKELTEKLKALSGKQTARKNSLPVVDEQSVAAVVSEWTKIPVKSLAEGEMERLRHLEDELHKRVIGQNEAVKAVSSAVRRGRAGFGSVKRPIGSFLFLGPTGVGKTEVSKALAEAVFGSEKSIIRVDMSEYMEKASVSKMIGSPPGYVGYDEGGQLTDRVRRNPYSVVLFDEIEKAHPDVFNILLQILDEGSVTDAQGRRTNFKNTVIIMTSNCGASDISDEKHLGFGVDRNAAERHELMKKKVMEAVKHTFRPEFLNRIDEIIVFERLGREEIVKIANLMLGEVANQARQSRNIELVFSEEVIDFIAEKGYDVKYGARPVRRAIQTYVTDMLSDALLEGRIKNDSTVRVVKDGDRLAIG